VVELGTGIAACLQPLNQFEGAARQHGGNSAFCLLSAGVDGFLVRAQMINVAERTIDLLRAGADCHR
jgi:hypothetical protein